MYKKILVAVDGYDPSLGAAKRAVEMAAQYGSQVIVMQVEEDIPLLEVEKSIEEASLTGLQHKPLTDKPLDLVAAYGQQHGIKIDTLSEKGGITACILKVSEDNDVDLIIIGDSGRKGAEKWYFGSVAQAVAEGARSPVLILKKGSVDISDMPALLPALEESAKLKTVKPVFQPEVFKQNFKFSFSLFVAFAIIYFGAVLLTSAPMKETAATIIMGLPLAIWAGWGTLIGGVLITRIYLAKSI
ncbi:universal stress protein [Desulfotalea psychrophila]|uniref:Universal stress protein n=1 Tax=Desulfotalea psychrophila TaxID=84980 RepID=A0ABS3AUV6_9BACT|nr:universal stress protein [Desulfocapsa sp.]MBN4052933.1 universal stress protein [bacterium AH-315-K15]MBN4064062.1 universal stress protein [bacterium AH-315-I07]MBN4068524.1 universal stress protein [Desulfotalea psychrophila]MBN4071655.1 universal stress protein [Desulfotalea psychrophila]